jgi:hypothetical protein
MAVQLCFTNSHETLQWLPQTASHNPAPVHRAVQSSAQDTEQLGFAWEQPNVQCPVAWPHSW